MTNPTQPKTNPLPAILVYGTPSGPALTQASWFRAEDKEAVKAAAEALKFSVIELQTDADKALAAGAHEGVLKGSGRMIVGSVSAEVYRRIEEHVRKGSSASDPSKPENAAATRDETRVRTKHEHRRRGCDLAARLPQPRLRRRSPAGQRDRSRNPSGRRKGPGRLLEREARVRGLLARHRQADRTRRIHPRVVRQPGVSGVQEPAPRTSPCRIPSSASRASDARKKRRRSTIIILYGAACGSPLLILRAAEPGARHPIPQPQETKP